MSMAASSALMQSATSFLPTLPGRLRTLSSPKPRDPLHSLSLSSAHHLEMTCLGMMSIHVALIVELPGH